MRAKLLVAGLIAGLITLSSCVEAPSEPQGQTDVPGVTNVTNAKVFPGTVILGRPTTDTVALSLLATANTDIFVQYGETSGTYDAETDVSSLQQDQPSALEITGLSNNTQYYYRVCHRATSEVSFSAGAEGSFHTQRAPGASFIFTVDADPHFDNNANAEKIELTFQNILNEHPDFNIDLGDTFMSEKLALQSYAQVASNYADKRNCFGIFGNWVPLYLAIGNHDGESGGALDGSGNNMAVWASKARQLYYLNPSPDGFYSGDSNEAPLVGLRGNYYAWQWGNALFVVLDPYWYSAAVKGLSGWDISLGKQQYDWLEDTLETSTAEFKFVFSHSLVGGADMGTAGKSRGGAEAAVLYEWGGQNADGTWGFDKYRPGWGKPIHQLLVDNHVTIFFHGHDHFFAKQELDGVIYQECPQPSANNDKNSAAAYGYVSGVFMSSPGHLKVTVTQDEVTVDYIKTNLPTEAGHNNGEVAYYDSITVQK